VSKIEFYWPVKAYITDTDELIVELEPADEGALPEDEAHSCDEMGCSTLGPHVLFRTKLPGHIAKQWNAATRQRTTEAIRNEI